MDALRRIATESGSVVKVFFTSWDNSKVSALLSDTFKVRIHNHDNREDIELFVRHHVTLPLLSCNLRDGHVSTDLQEDLVQALLDGAGGMQARHSLYDLDMRPLLTISGSAGSACRSTSCAERSTILT